ncbi:unnamed protein product [Eruca vesicaria subsp. sativa]|uniref:Dof zinc finger protein n=1 Tax=Eruca vesicaria subsp. sativa TaxID=29727 RepID=A0ABC8LK54_ERUVS|nr:unnamed protein product [Eruca vesicaria subsp. sativa]
MDATKWTQGFQDMMNVKPMEQIMIPNNNTHQPNTTSDARPNTILTSNGVSAAGATVSGVNNNNNTVERKARPQEKVNCPRCNSTNTKFCYYNNYSLTQPRYFCKGCRRYWTEGGSLRNVPVGGSSKKNKRPSSSSSNILQTTPSSLGLTTTLPDLNPPILFSNQIPNKSKGSSQDLNLLSFPVMQAQHHHGHMSQFLQMPKMEGTHQQPSSSSSLYGSSSSPVSALELLRTGANVSSRSGMNSFMPSGPMLDSTNNVLYTSSGFPTMVDYKPSNLSFSTDHQGMGQNNNNNSRSDDHHQGRILFPFGDQMKELTSGIAQEVDHDDSQQQKSHGDNNNNNSSSPNNGYWSGMFNTTGGGSSW